jgi:hypothetical protein
MSQGQAPDTPPQPPSSPVTLEEAAPPGNKKDPIPPLLTPITANDGKSCQALLVTQKLLVENSNKVTTFLIDYHDLFSNFQKFVDMINNTMLIVAQVKSLFNEESVKLVKDIPKLKERVDDLEKERHTPSPTFVLNIQKQLHYSTLGHVFQSRIDSCAHRLVINGIPRSSTYQQMSLVSVVNTAVIDKLELRDELLDFVRPTQVWEVGKNMETSNTFSLMAVFKHPSACYTIFKHIKNVPGGISIIKSVPEDYAVKYKEFRKTQAELRRIRDADNQQLVKTSIKFENGFMTLYYAHRIGPNWGPDKVRDFFFPEFKPFQIPTIANRDEDPIVHRNMIFHQPQDEDKRQALITSLQAHEKVLSAKFNARGWSCLVTFQNPVTQDVIDGLLKREEVKEIKG